MFPAIKYKSVPLEAGETVDRSVSQDDSESGPTDSHSKVIQVHRYLVISRERFIVLDSNGAGVGSSATVKSNHHLTEVTNL